MKKGRHWPPLRSIPTDLLIDVLLGVQSLGQRFKRRLDLVRRYSNRNPHLFRRAVKIAFGTSQPRGFILRDPVVREPLYVDTEDFKGLLLFARALKLSAVAVNLLGVAHTPSLVARCTGFVFLAEFGEAARFGHDILEAFLQLNGPVGVFHSLFRTELVVQKISGGFVP